MNGFDLQYLITVVFIAIFGVFGIYHFVSYLILRHKLLGYYCILIIGITLHWSWYLFPLDFIEEVASKASLITAMITTYGFVLFTINYLNINKSNHPRLTRCYTLIKYSAVLIPTLYILNVLTFKIDWLTNSLVMLAAITAALSTFLNIFSGVHLFKEEKFNKYYLYSYTPLLLAAIIYISAWFLKNSNLVVPQLVLLTTSILITLQLILYSILMGFKFKAIEDENIRTQIETNKILTLEVDKQTKNLQTAKGELEIKNQELETINGIKNKLFSLLTHDVRGPLNNITELVQIIEDQLNTSELQGITKKLKNKINDRVSMVNALLEWSYNQLEGIQLNKTSCDIKEMFDSIAQEFEQIAEDKEVTLVFEISHPNLVIDENMFKAILRNLTSNAIKFSKKGGKVILSSRKDSDHIEIGVQDFGVGMNTAWYENLKNGSMPKTKVGTNGEQGTGFGLLITKDFVEMNGGEMICKSELNQGTQFMLRF
ncbi:sensor histidine kinase [Croceitalea sp. P059]|uniref:sensor histidine kinase n=1 Tax=Croceitalea sp. P059 TaxID=3075601 RepID=UPI002885BAEF|nr:sensor histidine kinase [Croceitalea sp. P059]MDT0539747.1 sensor histidine kinase [Croceitalea sp. P059]